MTDTNTTIADNNEEVALVKTEKNTLTVNRTEATFTEAKSLLDEIDFDKLVASAEDIEELRQQGLVEEDYEVYTGEGTGAGGFAKFDNSYLHHRQAKFKDDSAITWTREVPKHIKETGVTAYPTEIALKHRVVGVRGFILKFEYGFGVNSMIETEVKDKDGTVTTKKIFPCKTEACLNLDNNTKVTSNRPLARPVSQLHKNKNEVDSLNPYFPWEHKQLQARKFDFDTQTYSKTPKSCQECISEGAWFITKDEKDTTKHKWGGDINNVIQGGKCSLNGNALFFVTQIGIDDLDSLHYSEDGDTLLHPREVKWVLPEDLSMKDRQGKQTGPFILRVEGMGRSVMQKIGGGQWDLNVKLPSQYKPMEEKTSYLPDDNVLSVSELDRFLYDKDHTERRIITENSGKTLFPVYTEMYFAPLVTAQTGSKSVTPVFRIIAVGINTEVEGVKMIDYLKSMVAVYSKEIAEANGEVTDIKVPSFPVVTPGVLPSYNTGNPTLTKKAFTPAIKTLPDTESVASKAFKSNLSKTAASAQPVPKAYSKPSKEDMLIEDEDDSDEDA